MLTPEIWLPMAAHDVLYTLESVGYRIEYEIEPLGSLITIHRAECRKLVDTISLTHKFTQQERNNVFTEIHHESGYTMWFWSHGNGDVVFRCSRDRKSGGVLNPQYSGEFILACWRLAICTDANFDTVKVDCGFNRVLFAVRNVGGKIIDCVHGVHSSSRAVACMPSGQMISIRGERRSMAVTVRHWTQRYEYDKMMDIQDREINRQIAAGIEGSTP